MTNLQDIADRLNKETEISLTFYNDPFLRTGILVEVIGVGCLEIQGKTEQEIRQRFNTLADTLYKNKL